MVNVIIAKESNYYFRETLNHFHFRLRSQGYAPYAHQHPFCYEDIRATPLQAFSMQFDCKAKGNY